MPKSAPETGVPNTAAKPALIPQITSRRRSSSRRRRMSANRLVRAAPICAAGPSLPTDPPNARVTTVALSFTGATSQSTRPARWCTAAMTASVPWPRASAAKVRMIQTQSGSATGRKMKTGTRPGVSARAQSAERARAQRNTRVPRPTQTPAMAPSIAHLSVLMSSAVCSVYQRVSSARRGDSSRKTMPRSRINRARRPENIRYTKRTRRVRSTARQPSVLNELILLGPRPFSRRRIN